jgi:hypothetical protein
MFIVGSVLCSSNQTHLIEQGGETALYVHDDISFENTGGYQGTY